MYLLPVVVIPGASSVSQLEANATAADITLTPDEQQALTTAAALLQLSGRRTRCVPVEARVASVVAPIGTRLPMAVEPTGQRPAEAASRMGMLPLQGKFVYHNAWEEVLDGPDKQRHCG